MNRATTPSNPNHLSKEKVSNMDLIVVLKEYTKDLTTTAMIRHNKNEG